MTDATDRKRQPRGVPTGGEFARNDHAEAPLGLPSDDAPTRTIEDRPFRSEFHELIHSTERSARVALAFEEIKKVVDDLDKDENWQRFLLQSSRFHRLSSTNSMLVHLQMPEATMTNSFNRWRELGRNVKDGAKGLTIIRPIFARREKDEDEDAPRRLVGFTPTTTFDISQTEGEDLVDIWEQSSAEPHPEYVADLESAIEREGFRLEYRDMTKEGGRRGYTSQQKVVVVDSTITPGARAAVLAHELGHIRLGHLDDMANYHTGLGGERSRMETEAETFAFVLGRVNGFEDDPRHSGEYLKSWDREPGGKELTQAVDRVKRSVRDLTDSPSNWRRLVA